MGPSSSPTSPVSRSSPRSSRSSARWVPRRWRTRSPRCFTDLLGVAYEEDGSLLKFGGDALLLLFAGDDPTEHAAVRRAQRSACASDSKRSASSTRPAAASTCACPSGAHSGRFDFFLVGESHRELIVTGPGSSRVVEMEGTAERRRDRDEPRVRGEHPAGRVGAPAGEGHFLRSAPVGDPAVARVGVARARRRNPRGKHPGGDPRDAAGGDRRAGAPAGVGRVHPLRRHRRVAPFEGSRRGRRRSARARLRSRRPPWTSTACASSAPMSMSTAGS